MNQTQTNMPAASPVGSPITRVDGPLKITGTARYTSDLHLDGMLYAVPVCATVAKGRITALDDRIAAGMPGVRLILTSKNIGPLHRLPKDSKFKTDETRPPLQDETIAYYGQYVALVVADTFEQATAAAVLVDVSYDSTAPDVSMTLQADDEPTVDSERGDVGEAWPAGAVTLDATYTTPPETHNPIELHATVAAWDGGSVTLYETSQAIMNHQGAISEMLGIGPDRVRVVSEYLGAGFGSKLFPWTHSLLAAVAARQVARPVKLVVSRKMMFQTVGHRTNTVQRMRLSAGLDGRLTSLQHDFVFHVAQHDKSKENCGEATAYLYSTPNLRVTAASCRRDIAPNTSMRGPGAVPGLFALESAMDELALKLGMDPVAFRLLNEPAEDESLGVPFSTRYLKECLETGADKFGWSRRTPEPGSMQQDGEILGWGMAACTWMAKRLPANVAVAFQADGSLLVTSATQDLGTGTYTVLTQMAARVTGVDVARIHVRLGDTALPPGPMSGGSMATASLVPAVSAAAKAAIVKLVAAAAALPDTPLAGADPATLVYADGEVRRADDSAGAGLPFARVLKLAGLDQLEAKGQSGKSDDDEDAKKVSIHSYGAHFVEVAWQPEIARLRIKRVVTVIDGGKVINPRTGRNQIEGAIMMGVGMALFEETYYDQRNGAPVNSNLADYVMTTNADAPEIDVTFLDHPDFALNELGARGIGEIGLAGLAPAITAAVYHATGVRVRDLPVRVEQLL